MTRANTKRIDHYKAVGPNSYAAYDAAGRVCGFLSLWEEEVKKEQPKDIKKGETPVKYFQDGYEFTEVWSETEEKHKKNLEIYEKAGWTILDEKPQRSAHPFNTKFLPYRTQIKRKITNIREG